VNRGKHRDVEFRIHPPGNTGFKSLRARMIWFDPQSEEARCAEFDPVAVSEPEGLAIRVTIPPFGTCTIDGLLNQAGTPDRDSAVRRHIADRVTAMVEPGKAKPFASTFPPRTCAATSGCSCGSGTRALFIARITDMSG
jgi:hypothetical protein